MTNDEQNVLQEIEKVVVRMDTKLDSVIETQSDHERRIRKMEQRWWGTLGAFVLSVTAYVKSIFEQ